MLPARGEPVTRHECNFMLRKRNSFSIPSFGDGLIICLPKSGKLSRIQAFNPKSGNFLRLIFKIALALEVSMDGRRRLGRSDFPSHTALGRVALCHPCSG